MSRIIRTASGGRAGGSCGATVGTRVPGTGPPWSRREPSGMGTERGLAPAALGAASVPACGRD